MLKLSLAHAIDQSTKLSVFEESMQATLEVTSHIPKEMASSGELKLKRREALRLTGRLFKLRVDVNLTSNVLDTPELFWSEASLKALLRCDPRLSRGDERGSRISMSDWRWRTICWKSFTSISPTRPCQRCKCRFYFWPPSMSWILTLSLLSSPLSTWIVIILIIVACAVAVGEISARFIVEPTARPRMDSERGEQPSRLLL